VTEAVLAVLDRCLDQIDHDPVQSPQEQVQKED
jgi:hypothetical protein